MHYFQTMKRTLSILLMYIKIHVIKTHQHKIVSQKQNIYIFEV